jgi:uncharacterized protein (TIGR01777 family)
MKILQPLRVLLAGGSGQVGTLLTQHFVDAGHKVVILTRGRSNGLHAARRVAWDGRSPGAWTEQLENTDVLINLCGRSVNCRYHKKNRKEILESRVESTALLGRVIAQCLRPPRLWMNASTATIYRHSLDRDMDELTGELGGEEDDAPQEWRFSIEVAKRWEEAFFSARAPRTRKIALRSAMTMSAEGGGVFDAFLRIVRFGLGGTLGSGKQYVSWIHSADFVSAIDFLISNQSLEGTINLASPNPLPNNLFMRRLREASGIRVGLPAPAWMLEVGAFLMGTETELLLKSRRVVPARLLQAGFGFQFPDWGRAAKDLFIRWQGSADQAKAEETMLLGGENHERAN